MSTNSILSNILGTNNKKKSSTPTIVSSLGGISTMFGVVVIIVIIGVILYAIRMYTKDDALNPILVPSPFETDKLGNYAGKLPLSGGQLYIGDGRSMSYSLWVYAKDWTSSAQNGPTLDIFTRVSPIGTENVTSLQLNIATNSLVVNTASTNCNMTPFTFSIPNFPLQKWVHIVYVLNGPVIDIYLNGRLRRSVLFRTDAGLCKLENEPTDHIRIGNSAGEMRYNGQISRFRYYSRALQPNDVISLYEDGPF